MRPKISVIVPIYNTEKYLSECLDSILGQTFKDLEVICINDGSPDDSDKILEEYSKRDSRIVIIRQKNMGLAEARNSGLRVASGEYIGFVDSDDWIDSTFYEKLISVTIGLDADIAVAGIRYFTDSWANREAYLDVIVTNFQDKIALMPNGAVWNKLFKASLIKDNNFKFPSGLFFEDNVVLFVAIYYSNKMVHTSDVCYNYRTNNDGICRSSDPIKQKKRADDKIIISKFILNFAKDKHFSLSDLWETILFLRRSIIADIFSDFQRELRDLLGWKFSFRYNELTRFFYRNDIGKRWVRVIKMFKVTVAKRQIGDPIKKDIKRLFIFAAYDKNGIIDRNLIYYLQSLSKFGDIIFVMDNNLQKSDMESIYSISNVLNIIAQRHNEYDFGSYKRGYLWALNNKILAKYDKVYFVNDSVIGPLCDLNSVLNEFELQNVNADAYGLVGFIRRQEASRNCWSYLKNYFQSWFFGLSKSIFLEKWFLSFLCSVESQKNKCDIVYKYEYGLNEEIRKRALKSLIFEQKYHGMELYEKPEVFLSRNLPFLKKSAIKMSGKLKQIRKYLPNSFCCQTNNRFLIHLHIYYKNQTKILLKKLSIVEKYGMADVFVTIHNSDLQIEKKIRRVFPKAKIITVVNIGADIYPFSHILNQVDLDSYDYIIKVHTKKYRKDYFYLPIGAWVNGRRWSRYLLSFLKSKNFKQSLLAFKLDKNIGMIADGRCINANCNKYASVTEKTKKLLKNMGFCDTVSYVEGTMFFARANLFKPFKNLNLTEKNFKTFITGAAGFDIGDIYVYEQFLGSQIVAQGYDICCPFTDRAKSFSFIQKTKEIHKIVYKILGVEVWNKKISFEKNVYFLFGLEVFKKKKSNFVKKYYLFGIRVYKKTPSTVWIVKFLQQQQQQQQHRSNKKTENK
ncbi:MAG: glycosyltransferase [Endomicrobium sp.]|nr:glycosyltransferase [Endomicrobium sp.]